MSKIILIAGFAGIVDAILSVYFSPFKAFHAD